MYNQNSGPARTRMSHYLRTGQKIGNFRPDSYKSFDLCNLCGGVVYDLNIKSIRSERNARYRALFEGYQAAKRAGKTHKIWHIAGGITTRESHRDANGQKVAIDENFQVGGEALFLPNDPEASLRETANCRCSVRFVGGIDENVIPGEKRKDHIISSRTFREDPVDIFLPENHGYSVIAVRMTSLGNSISAMKIPFSKLKIPKIGGNAIIIKISGFGP